METLQEALAMSKEDRPNNIPKLEIVTVGKIVDCELVGWGFKGSGSPDEVAEYHSPNWALYGGYTVAELAAIAERVNYEQ